MLTIIFDLNFLVQSPSPVDIHFAGRSIEISRMSKKVIRKIRPSGVFPGFMPLQHAVISSPSLSV